MKVLGIIPARYNSSRLPGKPMAMIGDQTLIMRVYNQCRLVQKFDALFVATDDKRIHNHVIESGGESIMTSEDHESGTERSNEVVQGLTEDYDFVVNVQGDEPFINPNQIDGLRSLRSMMGW